MYSEPEYVTKYMIKLSDAKKWSPMPCVPYEMWRVPVYKDDDAYGVVVQPDRVRYFTEETLPDFMKASLAMIHAFPPPKKQIHEVSVTDSFINYHNPKLDDVGWMVCKDLYIVIMHVTQLGEIGYSKEKSTWQIHLNAK
jgi:hypothetical protein